MLLSQPGRLTTVNYLEKTMATSKSVSQARARTKKQREAANLSHTSARSHAQPAQLCCQSPQEWRDSRIERLRDAIRFGVWNVVEHREDAVPAHLPDGLEPAATDLEAFRTKAFAAMVELEVMISKMRIVPEGTQYCGLRVVVDNTHRDAEVLR